MARLFLYYMAHSFKNQLKKMFKSWVLILVLACALFGGLIGFGAGKIGELAEQQAASGDAAETELAPEEFDPFEDEADAAEDEVDLFLKQERGQIVELIIGGVFLLLIVVQILGAEKTANSIFLPADAQLLFASPLKPQTVLLFRLMMQMAASVFAGIYLLFQLPNMMLQFGFGIWAALSMILAYISLIFFGRLLQVLIYTLASTHPGLQKKIRYAVFALLLILLGVYGLVYLRNGRDWYEALKTVFNAPFTRWLPFWGWLKGMPAFALEGNTIAFLISLCLLLFGMALLTYFVWHSKADFYEDAQARSEETAELYAAAKNANAGILYRGKNKKDRSERLVRDGLNRGQGASVFFWKAMYNRYRFAHFHFLTKTTETYLLATAAMLAFICLVVESRSPFPVMALLSVFVFYRSLGNPLNEDTKMSFFLMIPESCMKKLFFSLLGGTANTAIDLLPALIMTMIVLRAAPWVILGWLLFMLSLDFYSTVVATFIAASTPKDTGKIVNQVAQILFLYFGLVPSIGIIAVGVVLKAQTAALVIATLVNIAVASIFFVLTPLFLDPAPKQTA